VVGPDALRRDTLMRYPARRTLLSATIDTAFRIEPGAAGLRGPVRRVPGLVSGLVLWIPRPDMEAGDDPAKQAETRARRHLEQLLRTYVSHYNEHRPHRSLDLKSPDRHGARTLPRVSEANPVRRRDVLGGLIHEYEVAA